MGLDKNVFEWSLNVISLFSFCVNCEVSDWQLFLFLMILREKLANLCVISREITRIKGFRLEHDLMM